MKRIAVIPARGGSKRIPQKNIKFFLEKPIIAYSIETALRSGLFDEVMVSTDDQQIAQTAEKYGANVPFFRSSENSGDFATTADVLLEVLGQYDTVEFDYLCCIYPTAPFISVQSLKESFILLKNNAFETVFPVVQFSYPIQRSLKICNEKVSMVWDEFVTSRSQDLEPRYHDAGQFYWLDVNTFLNKKQLFTDNSGPYIIDEMLMQDIDNETDWKIAELKYKVLHD